MQGGNGLYLMRGLSPLYTVKRYGVMYRLYHKRDGFIISCSTQREVRNAVRAYSTNKTKTTKGRE